MEKVERPVQNHPLLPFDRIFYGSCRGCWSDDFLYGGYRCNELGCSYVFHKECAESAPEINHHSHPKHPLKLVLNFKSSICCLCRDPVMVGYSSSICDFKLDLAYARKPPPPLTLEHTKAHEHPLVLSNGTEEELASSLSKCKVCGTQVYNKNRLHECPPCNLLFEMECAQLFSEAYHASHPKHPLKFLTSGVPSYAERKCLLCARDIYNLHHCDIYKLQHMHEVCDTSTPS